MIGFFRKMRKKLADNHQPTKYFRYAIGEIVLVMVGILLALQVNNLNEERKIIIIEHTYLKNIKEDLNLNLSSLKMFVEDREKAVDAVDSIMQFFNDIKVLDLNAFNRFSLDVMVWYPFEQHDNTYKELLNSGNLSIIRNKNIKDNIQNMQTSFKRVSFIEGEMQQDFETYLYHPFFTTIDLDTSLKNYNRQVNKELQIYRIDINQVNALLKNQNFKNGFVLTDFNSNLLIKEYSNIMDTTKQLIVLINEELAKKS